MARGKLAISRNDSKPAALTRPRERGLAWLVHLYTATGAVIAFLGMRAVVGGEYRAAFLWMFVATLVDASDGWLARRARVGEILPHFNGQRLDDIVDYLTFVFLPAFLLDHAGALPGGWGWTVAGAMLLASACGFSRDDAKTADHFFTGFPSYWNIVAFYLYAAGTGPAFNAVVLLVLSALVFVPMRYVYPSRTPALRTVTVVLGLVWGGLIAVLMWQLPTVSRALLAVSLFFPVYYTILSAVLHGRRRA